MCLKTLWTALVYEICALMYLLIVCMYIIGNGPQIQCTATDVWGEGGRDK